MKLSSAVLVLVTPLACATACEPPFPTHPLLGAGGSANSTGTGASYPLPPDFVSGTRLRAVYYDDGQGSVLFTNWHDTLLDEDCAFILAEDGEQRCLPFAQNWWNFADPACTKPVIVVRDGASPKYIAEDWNMDSVSSWCAPLFWPTKIYAVGTQLAATKYYEFCGPDWEVALDAGDQLLLRGAKLDPSTFVRATYHAAAVTSTIGVSVLVGDDGSSARVGLFDVARQAPCEVPQQQSTLPSGVRCLPASPLTHAGEFADASCAEPLGITCALADVGVSIATTTDSCEVSRIYVAAGPQVSPPTVYESAGPQCSAVASQPIWGPIYQTVRAAIDASSFPVVSPDHVGNGRLRVPRFFAENGAPLLVWLPMVAWSQYQFFDTQRKLPCAVLGFWDSTLRCATFADAAITDVAFADPACTTLVAKRLRGYCPSDTPLAVAMAFGPGFETILGLHAVGGQHNGVIYYQYPGETSCTPGAPQAGETYYDLGPALDPSIFAEVTLLTQ